MTPDSPCPCGGKQKSSGWAKIMAPPIKHYRCSNCGADRWYQEGRHVGWLDGAKPAIEE